MRTETATNPIVTLNATSLEEPFLQVVVRPEGIKVHIRSERIHRHGFRLADTREARLLITALEAAIIHHQDMPPTPADVACAHVRDLGDSPAAPPR